MYGFKETWTYWNKSLRSILGYKFSNVCCTRAKENLAVFYQSPSKEIIETAQIWFDNNIIDLD